MIRSIATTLLLCCMLLSCTEEEYDKQIRLEIGLPNYLTNSTAYELTTHQTFHLIKFNKLHYANVESITFVPSMYASRDVSLPGETTTCFVELYNVTDNVSISNTELQSDINAFIFKESGNIYNDLPAKEITLGIRVKTSNPLLYAGTGVRSYLFINKR